MNTEKLSGLFIMPAAVTIALLAIPFFAKADWNLLDFVVAGFLLFTTGFIFKLITFKATNLTYKIAAAIALGSGLFLIWANLAVGIIGEFTEHPINLVYFEIIAIGIIGTIITRFQAKGMKYTMLAMTGALFLIAFIVLLIGTDEKYFPSHSHFGFWVFHFFFAVQFIISALLFHRSANEQKVSATKN